MMTRTRKFSDIAGYAMIYSLTALAFIPLVAFIVYLIAKGIGRINFEFLFTASASMESRGILAPLFGTIVLTLASLLFAVPISLLAAVYLSEYARKDRWFNIIELTIVNLAGVPSVVYGLFGLGLFVIFLGLGQIDHCGCPHHGVYVDASADHGILSGVKGGSWYAARSIACGRREQTFDNVSHCHTYRVARYLYRCHSSDRAHRR
jgi:ABC-type phosphate transport system permease subunit